MGRPSGFSQDIADTIINRLVEGESLKKICRDDAMPATSMIMRWLSDEDEDKQGFREQYTRAREAQADGYADEIVDIADEKITEENRVFAAALEQQRKTRIAARQWAAGKVKPQKYGDRLDITMTADIGPGLLAALERVKQAEIGHNQGRLTDVKEIPEDTKAIDV